MDFAALSFTAFSIFGIFGNVVSILALSRSKRLRNATTAFIINLCAADLLLCMFSMPMSALSFFERRWNYGESLCILFPLLRYSNGAVSLESIIAIAVNRYVLVVYPNLYQKIYTATKVFLMIAAIWVLTLITLLFPLLQLWGMFGYDPRVGTCTILPLNGKSPKTFYYILGFVLPSVIFVFCYSKIYCVVHRASEALRKNSLPMKEMNTVSFSKTTCCFNKRYRHAEESGEKRERKDLRILKVLIVLFLSFVFTFLPVSLVKIFKKEDDFPILNIFGYLGIYLSSIINPVIYIVMSREYRRAYSELFAGEQASNSSISSRRPNTT
ncbi:G-protein coupled receptor moody-like [Uloborus diversus]|uniref:G-protein coupled receptor moody-like n=1 Tax=Uloborus diversus TaxID=327109 RepID=UPI00240A6BAD|nr:G-protein coupled receptor moody-like [Uloborus diversus]